MDRPVKKDRKRASDVKRKRGAKEELKGPPSPPPGRGFVRRGVEVWVRGRGLRARPDLARFYLCVSRRGGRSRLYPRIALSPSLAALLDRQLGWYDRCALRCEVVERGGVWGLFLSLVSPRPQEGRPTGASER